MDDTIATASLQWLSEEDPSTDPARVQQRLSAKAATGQWDMASQFIEIQTMASRRAADIVACWTPRRRKVSPQFFSRGYFDRDF
jgi:hypothetical protein